MKAIGFGMMPAVIVIVAFLTAVSAAWPQGRHYGHRLFHRAGNIDRKGRHGDSNGDTTSAGSITSPLAYVNTATGNVSYSAFTANPTTTILCDANTGVTRTPTPSASSGSLLSKFRLKRWDSSSSSSRVVYVTSTHTVTVEVETVGTSIASSGTLVSSTTSSGSSNLVSSATSTTSSDNLFGDSYGAYLRDGGSQESSVVVSTSTVATTTTTYANPYAGSYQAFRRGRRHLNATVNPAMVSGTGTSSSAAPSNTEVCPSGNGTVYTSLSGQQYEIVCGLDFSHDDIFPYLLVTSFYDCVRQCDNYNAQNPDGTQCMAALFAPGRVTYANDCYLKHSVDFPKEAQISLYGAIIISNTTTSSASSSVSMTSSAAASSSPAVSSEAAASSSTSSAGSVTSTSSSSAASSSSSSETSSSSSSISTISETSSSAATSTTSSTPSTQSSSSATSSTSLGSSVVVSPESESSDVLLSTMSTPSASVSQVSTPSVKYASASTVIPPTSATATLHGVATDVPTTSYISYDLPAVPTLDASLYTTGVNARLTDDYPLSPLTGNLQLNSSTESLVESLQHSPHMSRDGGKGGYLNGEHLFIYCDTGSYTPATASEMGNFLGFVSSSVSVDSGMNGLTGEALNLVDGVGGWSDDVGRMRGFSPMTEGELAYNLEMQGGGQRYAVWPESSLIPLDATRALLYAPIIYDNVDMETREAEFTYIGNTLLTITAGFPGGPLAERTVSRLFTEDEVQWGSIGGLRSWGVSGIGGNDGRVYLFGDTDWGILVARTTPGFVANRDSYEYWSNGGWSDEMIPETATDFLLAGSFMDVDMFYSPRHLTFIMVYLTGWADSTFYYRYLDAPDAILPPYAGGDPSVDFAEAIVKYPWSEEQVLYEAPLPKNGEYIYAGGVHQGYFGEDDITNGGSKILLSWTAPTGEDPATLESEYELLTVAVDLD